VFILDVFYNRGSIKVAEIEQNIDSAKGWMMLAHLLKAGLIDDRGDEIYITEVGRELYGKIERISTSSGK
jgi:predicted transcriptional regulator